MNKFFDFEDFGRSLKHSMKYGYTMRSIGKEAGVHHTAISRVMNYKPISINNLVRIADWMGVKLDDFIKSQPDPS